MAKRRRSKKQMAAFRKMIGGLRRWKAGKAKRRKSRPARARRRKTIAIETNPRRRRRRTRRRQETMAKRRRRPRGARRQVSTRRRRRAAVLLVNPRRRRHGRRRRNPGFSLGAAAKDMAKALLPGFVAGGLMGVVDAKFLGDKALPIQVVAKMGIAAAAGALLRKRPTWAYSAMGAILGATGYGFGVRLGGGVVAATKGVGMQQLSEMARSDQQAMGLLMQQMNGMGILTQPGINGVPNTGGGLPDLEGDDSDDSLAAAMAHTG